MNGAKINTHLMPRETMTPIGRLSHIADEDPHQLGSRHTTITPVVLPHAAVTTLDDEPLADGAGPLDVPLVI